ncbi:MAG: tRNA lysidine(34) synthetase TilS [Lachnospiraceae bacterium]|nr:tRNA lysidine(34) synthetase TilS [Lachnospiraceae bacterium]
MLQRITRYAEEKGLLAQGDRLVIGVSGGADSMCLLLVLAELRKSHALALHVVHVHHGIRGEEADRDAAFVEETCRSLEVPCRVVRVPVPELAREQGIGLEEAGRNARRRCFLEEALRVGANKICLAHHRDDQAETVLFRALRGTGIRGLAGMAPLSRPFAEPVAVVRPLLCVGRAEILEFLRAAGQSWREDSTNGTDAYTRNFLRNQVFPLLRQVNPQAELHLAQLAEQAGSFAEWTEAELAEVYENAVRGDTLRIAAVQELPDAPRREVLLRWLRALSGENRDWNALHAEEVERLMRGQTGREVCLPYGVRLVREYDRICRKSAETPEAFPTVRLDLERDGFAEIELTGNQKLRISLKERKKEEAIPKNKYTKWFDYDKIGQELSIRTRRAGDYLNISVNGGRKRLQDYFVDARIPADERGSLPLLTAGSLVLWVVGYRTSESCRVDDDTRRVLAAELWKADKDKGRRI